MPTATSRRLSHLPEQNHGTDFSRVRPYFLEGGQAAAHRQLIVTTHFNKPALQASFRTDARSVSTKVETVHISLPKSLFKRVPSPIRSWCGNSSSLTGVA
jgi:hypothetical protein